MTNSCITDTPFHYIQHKEVESTGRIRNQGQANAGVISISISANQIKAISQISKSVVVVSRALYTLTMISDCSVVVLLTPHSTRYIQHKEEVESIVSQEVFVTHCLVPSQCAGEETATSQSSSPDQQAGH